MIKKVDCFLLKSVFAAVSLKTSLNKEHVRAQRDSLIDNSVLLEFVQQTPSLRKHHVQTVSPSQPQRNWSAVMTVFWGLWRLYIQNYNHVDREKKPKHVKVWQTWAWNCTASSADDWRKFLVSIFWDISTQISIFWIFSSLQSSQYLLAMLHIWPKLTIPSSRKNSYAIFHVTIDARDTDQHI